MVEILEGEGMMNSLEKINDIQYLIMENYSDSEPLSEEQEGSKKCFMQYCKDIRNDLKLLNLLKEKKVELGLLDTILCFYTMLCFSIDHILDQYNGQADQRLTKEEMILIVEWLKEDRSE